MSEDADKMSPVKELTLETIKKYADKAEHVAEWIDAAPDVLDIGQLVILGALAAKEAGMAEDEIERIIKWVNGRYIDIALIAGVARGHLGITWPDGAEQPAFCVTERGKQHIQKTNTAHYPDPEMN